MDRKNIDGPKNLRFDGRTSHVFQNHINNKKHIRRRRRRKSEEGKRGLLDGKTWPPPKRCLKCVLMKNANNL
jgi:hypothetical protein